MGLGGKFALPGLPGSQPCAQPLGPAWTVQAFTEQSNPPQVHGTLHFSKHIHTRYYLIAFSESTSEQGAAQAVTVNERLVPVH